MIFSCWNNKFADFFYRSLNSHLHSCLITMSQRCCLPVARAVRGAALHIICTLQGHYTPDSQRIRSSEPPGWRGLACLCSLFVTPAETEECWSAVTLWARVYIWPQPRVTVCTTGPDPGRGGWPGPPAPTLGLQLQFFKKVENDIRL